MRSTRALLTSVLTFLVAAALALAVVPSAASAAPTASPDQARTLGPISATQMSVHDYTALKQKLDRSSDLTRTVAVRDGLRTFTYTDHGGMALSLQFPANPTGVMPMLSVDGCGFLQLCVDFNSDDQKELVSIGGFGLATAICAIPAVGEVACGFAQAAVNLAVALVNKSGLCKNNHVLRVRLLPFPGDAHCE
jgi:hypothetical protein